MSALAPIGTKSLDDKLTLDQWETVKMDRNSRDFKALNTAGDLGVKVREVIRATKCATYEEYERAFDEVLQGD